jgi:hypothetical protein
MWRLDLKYNQRADRTIERQETGGQETEDRETERANRGTETSQVFDDHNLLATTVVVVEVL